MWNVTPRFLTTIRQSHEVVTQVDVLDRGQPVLRDVEIVGGEITRDRTAAVYGTCHLTLPYPLDLPGRTLNHQLAELGPGGYELRIKRGVRYPDTGRVDVVPLGIFGIQTADHREDGTVELEGSDRSQLIADDVFRRDYHVANGAVVTDTIVAFATRTIADLNSQVETGPVETLPRLVYSAGDNVWEACQQLGVSDGREVFFDGVGRLVIRYEPELMRSSASWTVDEGPTGVLVSAALHQDRTQTFNHVVVYGQNLNNSGVVRSEATDTDDASPTKWDGRFGRRTRVIHSDRVSTESQAARMARAVLLATIGRAHSLDFAAVPNPALEPGDIVHVVNRETDIDRRFIIDSITLGLGADAGAMTCSVRSRQEIEESGWGLGITTTASYGS